MRVSGLVGSAAIALGIPLAIATLHLFEQPPWEISNHASDVLPLESSVTLPSRAIMPQQLTTQWVVNPAEAKWLLEQGATLLDARSSSLQWRGMLQGAIAVNWQQFSQSDYANQGMLLADDQQLTQRLREVGVFNQRPVVVVADPQRGWGEDGRVVWMLRTLGHRQAVLVDGGYAALVAAGIPVVHQVEHKSATLGDFVIDRTTRWEVTREQLRTELKTANVVVIDVREAREFSGDTPYGEQRSGHIPGAIHLHYRELLRDGMLLSRSAILEKLQEKGIAADAQIITYCTAGVRAGWMTSVLTNLGLRAKNYPGSMLDWSAASPEDYPLVTDIN